MIEKIEITQRFNFKRLNRHYECFTIDFINKNAYYKISERGSGDKFLTESEFCDKTWTDILVNLRSEMTSKIYPFSNSQEFIREFEQLNLFENFQNENFSYFEKIELIYSCNVIIYSTSNYQEYSFKNNFPKNWTGFAELLEKYFNFDVLHLNHQKHLATPLFYKIKEDGIYDGDRKLAVKTIEFGHYKHTEIPYPRIIINIPKKTVKGYIEKHLRDTDKIMGLLEKYHVYKWTQKEYHNKSDNHDSDYLDGYDWYLEIVLENNVIWHVFGYNDYPDTYLQMAREIIKITGMDLLEISAIDHEEVKLFEKYGEIKLKR